MAAKKQNQSFRWKLGNFGVNEWAFVGYQSMFLFSCIFSYSLSYCNLANNQRFKMSISLFNIIMDVEFHSLFKLVY